MSYHFELGIQELVGRRVCLDPQIGGNNTAVPAPAMHKIPISFEI